jgi:ribosomal protein S18 acetylase RimI-like enzyme
MEITLRPTKETDAPFLRQLFESWKADDFGLTKLDPVSFAMLIDIQWLAHSRSGAATRPGAESRIVVVDGQDAGHLVVERSPGLIHLSEIALLPDWRNRGLGQILVKQLQDEARASGAEIRLHVARHNPAQRFYGRLNFTPVENHGAQLPMVWRHQPA